jgi:glycosyltransferase involved in cell wall biosynthesis
LKILIIHQHFRTPNQGGSIRSYHIARELSLLGNQVSVISSSQKARNYVTKVENFEIRYLKVRYENSFGFARRMISYSSFLLKAIYSLKLYKDYDVCYVMSTPLSVGIIGLWAKSHYKIPYVFEVGDLWPDIPIQMGIIRNPIFKWSVLKLEKLIYSKSKFIVALSNEMKQLIQVKVKDKQITVIENFADSAFFKIKNVEIKIPSTIKKGNVVISYIGTLGIANKVETLIKLAGILREEAITIVIKGSGKELRLCQGLANKLNLHNVIFMPFGSKDEIKELLAYTDAIYVSFDKRYPLLTTGCPNKLIDGIAAGNIVLMNYGGWQKELIKNTKCGIIMDIDNPADCLNKARSILLDPGKREVMKNNSRMLAQKFEVKLLVERLYLEIAKALN